MLCDGRVCGVMGWGSCNVNTHVLMMYSCEGVKVCFKLTVRVNYVKHFPPLEGSEYCRGCVGSLLICSSPLPTHTHIFKK